MKSDLKRAPKGLPVICFCFISLFEGWICRASCTPIFGFKMEAGLDVCYLYERYLLTQQIDCLCLFSVTSAGSTRTKSFWLLLSVTVDPIQWGQLESSLPCVSSRGAGRPNPEPGRACWRAQLDLHALGELGLLVATGPLGWGMWHQVVAGLEVEPVELRAHRTSAPKRQREPRVRPKPSPVPRPARGSPARPPGEPWPRCVWVLRQECGVLLAERLRSGLYGTDGVLEAAPSHVQAPTGSKRRRGTELPGRNSPGARGTR